MKKFRQKGFTLIELLVVIAIIGLLSTIVLVSINSVREKAKYTRVKADIDQIVKAMKMYEMDIGELPPRGDSCPACCYPDCQGSWDAVINVLLNNDGAGWNGPYLQKTIHKDPWGNHFYYDDNACNSNCGNSYLGSAGSDGVKGTGDDYKVIPTTHKEVINCCY